MAKTKFNMEEAIEQAKILGIDWGQVKFDQAQWLMGMNVELEHGLVEAETNVTNDEPLLTAKIAWAHLREYPDYYIRLGRLEDEAENYWEGKEKYNN